MYVCAYMCECVSKFIVYRYDANPLKYFNDEMHTVLWSVVLYDNNVAYIL